MLSATRRRFLRRPAAFVLVLTLGAAGLLWGPEALRSQTGDSISAGRILATARDLSGETSLSAEAGPGPPSRYALRPSTAVYVDYLEDRLAAALAPLGGEVSRYAFDPEFETLGGDSVRFPYTNIVGIVEGARGAEKPGFFLLGAHFDATAQADDGFEAGWRTHPAPGADDNGSGVAVVLEVARVLAARGSRPEAAVVFTLFDGEEQQIPEGDRSLLGSTHAASEARLDSLERELGHLHAMIAIDMIAYNPRQDSLVVVSNLTSRWLANRLLRVHDGGAPSDPFEVTRVVEGFAFSDHGPFWARGRDAVLLVESTDVKLHAPHYHRSIDTVDNTYLRGGSQARKTAELLLDVVESWIPAGDLSALEVTGEDILFRRGAVVDASIVTVGSEVGVRVGVTNYGATRTQPWQVAAEINADGRFLSDLGVQDGPVPFVTGARHWFTFPWTPTEDQAGAPYARARILASENGGASEDAVSRRVAVQGQGARVVRAYVYPNPTRLAQRAVLHYEISQGGGVILTLLDNTGREIDTHNIPYDRVDPATGTGVGEAELPIAEIFPRAGNLAPGVYLVRVELFDGDTPVDVSLVKWAVLR